MAERGHAQGLGKGAAEPIAGLDVEAAVDLLLALNISKSLRDLSPLASVGLHKLKGDRKGRWAITVNGPWRICRSPIPVACSGASWRPAG